MKFSRFLEEKIIFLLANISLLFLLSIYLFFLQIPLIFILVLIILYLGIMFGYLVIEYQLTKKKYNEIIHLVDSLNEKYLITDIIKKPNRMSDRVYYYALKKACKDMNDKISDIEKKSREYQEYIESFAHEIKTPIASLALYSENKQDKQMKREVKRIDNLVEQVLYYARSETVERDYFIRQLDLEELMSMYDAKTLYELYKREAEKSARQSERIIVISDAQQEQFNELFPGNEPKVRLLENGYDAKVFYQDKTVSRQPLIPELIGQENADYDNMVLFVGKFADFKGIDALLDAAKIYEKDAEGKNKKIETIIVGSGVLDDKLRKQAETLGLQHTHFVGRKNHSEICQLQNLATVSLIPSRNEPFGLVVIEGTACGHPVIATNSGGIPGILNTDKKDLSDKDKSYVTRLGVLIPPLPDRPSELSDEEKDRLDEMTTIYSMMENEDEKQDFMAQMGAELHIDEGTL